MSQAERTRAGGRSPLRSAALQVVDDTGAEHRHEATLMRFLWIAGEADAAGRAIRRHQMMVGWDQSMGRLMGLGFAAVFITFRVVGFPDTVTIPLAVAVGLGGAWLMAWSAHRRLETHWESLGRQWTDAGLSRGQCPLCLYHLAESAADEQGMVLCAECGARWRVERLGSVEDREPSPWRRALNALVGADTRRKLTDDTGRTFAAERLGRIASRCARRDPQVAQVARHVRREGAALRGLAMAAALTVFALPALLLLLALAGGGAGGAFAAPVFPLLFMFGMVIPGVIVIGAIAHSEWGVFAATRRQQMLAAGLCPVCAGRQLGESEEGLVCAGCGAEWRQEAGS